MVILYRPKSMLIHWLGTVVSDAHHAPGWLSSLSREAFKGQQVCTLDAVNAVEGILVLSPLIRYSLQAVPTYK